MRDSEIEQWVLSEMRMTTDSRLKEVCVFSLNGVVSLKGTVNSRSDKLMLQTSAECSRGVVKVINCLKLRKRELVQRGSGVKSQLVSTVVRTQSPPEVLSVLNPA
jgi:hypothetical protein